MGPGQVVITEGEVGDRFYMLEEGSCYAYKEADPNTSLKEYTSMGEYFGELALLSDDDKATRKASIKTRTNCKFACVDKKTFKRMLGPAEEIMKRQADTMY